jgi:prepilin-type N-terminal cleavage/methylation domain-containing protein
MQHSRHNRFSGFTLIELLVVITIIGVLTSVVLSSISTARVNARDSARLQEARQLMSALELYRNTNGGYPCSGNFANATQFNCTNGADNTSNTSINVKSTSYTGVHAHFRTAVNYTPLTDSGNRIIYRVASQATSGINADNADRSGYILYILLEGRPACVVRVGEGVLYNAWGTTPACTFLVAI